MGEDVNSGQECTLRLSVSTSPFATIVPSSCVDEADVGESTEASPSTAHGAPPENFELRCRGVWRGDNGGLRRDNGRSSRIVAVKVKTRVMQRRSSGRFAAHDVQDEERHQTGGQRMNPLARYLQPRSRFSDEICQDFCRWNVINHSDPFLPAQHALRRRRRERLGRGHGFAGFQSSPISAAARARLRQPISFSFAYTRGSGSSRTDGKISKSNGSFLILTCIASQNQTCPIYFQR